MSQTDPVSGHLDASYLVLKRRVWTYRRRVPTELARLDPRGEIRISTGTREKARANLIALRFNEALEAHWRNLVGSAAAAAVERAGAQFEAAVRQARALGLAYRSATELATAKLSEHVARAEMLETKVAPASPAVVRAVLGGEKKPELALSTLFAAYEKQAADRLIGKSQDQVRKWRNPRLRAIGNLIDLVGDKALAELTRNDALDFRSWWLDRVRDEHYDQGSANKDLGCIASMMRTVDMAFRLDLSLPFSGVRISGERHNPRVAYDAAFVRERILPGHEFGSLNPEARAIVRIVAATGMRPSEVAALTRPRIVLEADVPHLQVRPDERQLKTDHSQRDMPLVGVALTVMQEFRDGFARYRSSPDSFSATANKALGAAGLRPTLDHTAYSLRHTFKDRLIAIEAPERIQDELMGHAIREIKYGAGSSFRQRADWLAKVWA